MSKFKLTQTAAEVQDILNNCNGLKSDGKGNLTVGKNLGVDGKLTLKSLISESNPDGDITKELGGGDINLYHHTIRLIGKNGNPPTVISFDLYNTYSATMKWSDLHNFINSNACSGYVRDGSGETPKYYFANYLYSAVDSNVKTIHVFCADDNRREKEMKLYSSDCSIID